MQWLETTLKYATSKAFSPSWRLLFSQYTDKIQHRLMKHSKKEQQKMGSMTIYVAWARKKEENWSRFTVRRYATHGRPNSETLKLVQWVKQWRVSPCELLQQDSTFMKNLCCFTATEESKDVSLSKEEPSSKFMITKIPHTMWTIEAPSTSSTSVHTSSQDHFPMLLHP